MLQADHRAGRLAARCEAIFVHAAEKGFDVSTLSDRHLAAGVAVLLTPDKRLVSIAHQAQAVARLTTSAALEVNSSYRTLQPLLRPLLT